MNEMPIGQEPPVAAIPEPGSSLPRTAERAVRPARRRLDSPKKTSGPANLRPTGKQREDRNSPTGRSVAGPQTRFAGIFRRARSRFIKAWHWLQKKRQRQLASKRLALCETVSLGEKRFLAIVKVDGQQFLVGGAAGSLSMLARLSQHDEFGSILQQRGKRGGAVQ